MIKARYSTISRTIYLLIAVFLLSFSVRADENAPAAPDSQKNSIYVFLPQQSTVVQTGGIAGIHRTYVIEGQFQLSIDPNMGSVFFTHVDANAVDDSPYKRSLDPNEVFNLAGLVGIIVDDTLIYFAGRDSNGSDIFITAILNDDLIYIFAQTYPPAGSADFFIFNMDAVAQRKYGGGTGEPNDPYKIASSADLIELGDSPEDYDKHFILTADIDLYPNLPGGKVFDKAVIAFDTNDATPWSFDGNPFVGVFDGNGYTISHLTITGKSYLGLFGRLGVKAEVKNLGVVDAQINGSGFFDFGGLVGCNSGSVIQCYSSGIIIGGSGIGGLVGTNYGTLTRCSSTGSVSGNDRVGGLVGFNERGNITNCYSTSIVTGSYYVGGLVGSHVGNITNCYSTGVVTGNEAIGGLVGRNGIQGVVPNPGYIKNSYSLTSVRGEIFVGGLVGDNRVGDVMQCYSAGGVSGNESVGGLVGLSDWGGVLRSVWDVETSGLSGSAGGVGLTTREMMDPYMLGLNGFADDPNWVLDPGRNYPRLAWEGTPGQIIAGPDINWLTGRGTSETPYKIDTFDQFIMLSKGSVLWDKHFVLGADIDLNPVLPNRIVFEQAPIQVFTGVFDGNGHVISCLTIKGVSYLGLFGLLGVKAEVKKLGVVDVHITGSGGCIGGIVGFSGGCTMNCC
ncbi:MAG: hypothetical protein A2167_08115 [Planctomycetes bacterium RBG_13_46_10]|nr:MAG: hypothetical protein A2167_08115 [Planctomycetes bacterium RBG_13_46_10]